MAAETILSSVADGIIGQLGKALENEIDLLYGVEDELQKLEDTISTIKSVLVDAEKQQLQHQQIKTWLKRLEDAVYEADDLVDEFSTEALRRQLMTRNTTMAKKVRTFCCSTSNPLAFRHKMGNKIRDIRKKLDAIERDKNFHLVADLEESKVVIGEWEEHSFERQENIIGRADDKNKIIRRLIDMKVEKNMVVIPIVGVGGLGKTSLAQLVSSDAKVKDHFELLMWVNVPKVFDVKLIVKQIVQSGVKEEGSIENISMDQLQKDLREKIKGKRYLIVLDDVWNSDHENIRENWLRLENLLRDGANGSRIIVTTRDEMVARIINGPKEPAYLLGILDEERSWLLFKKLAFVEGQEPKNSNLVEIGKEIMNKCGGIPLVIRTIGSMLYSIDVQEWSSFKEKELSAISQYDNNIIPRLKLSYDHLPSHLKHCFAYCSLFPKNHIFDVKKLINLWMAQGFIKISSHQERPEDMGYQQFKDLLYRSFFEKVEMDEFLNITECKMHDCMHDLAMSVAGPQCVMLNLNGSVADDDDKIDTKTHHVSFNSGLRDEQNFPDLLVRAKRIRTIVFNKKFSSWRRLSFDKIDLHFKFLRTLVLSRLEMEIVPDSIGRLKHLRCLDLSCNDTMKVLPDSIANLHNLQTLDLSFCTSLEALPGDIWKLVNLRHLNVYSCANLNMPRGLGQLTNLQTLTRFQVKAEHGGQLNELKNLNNLRGHLEIVVGKDGIKSEGANLKSKQHLQSLELRIDGKMVDDCEDLVPHSNVKELTLDGSYPGVALLNCVPSLKNLVEFKLSGHKECQNIEALNHLPYLKLLWLVGLPAVEYISSDEYDGNLLPFFPSLQQLYLLLIPNLKGWWKDVVNTENTRRSLPFFPCLSQLYISGCPNLICMPLFPYLQELRLWQTSIKPFQQTLMMKNIVGPPTSSDRASSPSTSSALLPLSTLKILNIGDIHDVQYFPVGFETLTSLNELTIRECSKLESLSPGLHHLTSLQHLVIRKCEELEMPPNNGSDAIMWQHLGSLSTLELYGLPKLVALPEGLQQVTSLQQIRISHCEILEAVLECIKSLKSLQFLQVEHCPSLKTLPEGIDSLLASLKRLEITACPILLERCRKDTGEYWPIISHIEGLILNDNKERL